MLIFKSAIMGLATCLLLPPPDGLQTARFVSVQLLDSQPLSLAEVRVYHENVVLASAVEMAVP